MTDQPDHRTSADFWRRGTVTWFNIEKGFGFLQPDDHPVPVFVEYTSIETTGYKSLMAGQPVLFRATMRKRGPEATAVRPLLPNARAAELEERTRAEITRGRPRPLPDSAIPDRYVRCWPDL